MMKLARNLAALAVAAAATVPLAPLAPVIPVASANPGDPAPEGTVEGVYTFTQGEQSATWRITPLCVPIVGDGRVPLELAIGCKLQIESDGIPGQSGLYLLSGGRWTYSKPLLAGKKCPNGKTAATQETYRFDTSLNGTYSQSHNAVCGDQPGIDNHPFTLTYVGPLPYPVNHYPLNCQDTAIHLCS